MDSVAEILPIVAHSISTHSPSLSRSLSARSRRRFPSPGTIQNTFMLFLYQTHWFDSEACKAFTFARTSLSLCVCVCSLTKDTYVFECILRILSCICQCAGLCARVWVFATILAPFCLVRFKCWNFNAAHITFPFLCLRTYGMHSTECRISLAIYVGWWGVSAGEHVRV